MYQRIAAQTDCDALQGEFDKADRNHGRDLERNRADLAEIDTAYMTAAQRRMEELGC
ncbi:MAG TPA: hypothetical protein VFU43_18660 [Streptosporangiaceae bacterium]|nr:hypothetical protein [Streptosporangiaceae bacterium]